MGGGLRSFGVDRLDETEVEVAGGNVFPKSLIKTSINNQGLDLQNVIIKIIFARSGMTQISNES